MALTTHAHFLLHVANWMVRGPGDLPLCIGWVFCDHFSHSSHDCLIFFLKPSFLLTSMSSWVLGDDIWYELCGFNKRAISFLPKPVIDNVSASILWSLNGTVFLVSRCLCDTVECVMHTSWCIMLHCEEWMLLDACGIVSTSGHQCQMISWIICNKSVFWTWEGHDEM